MSSGAPGRVGCGKPGPSSTRGVPFEKFAAKRIKWRVLDRVRVLNRDAIMGSYGFDSTPRWIREIVGIGATSEEENFQEE